MKISAILSFIVLVLIGCTKDESPTVTPKLKNCGIQYLLLFDDLERLNSGNPFFTDISDTSGAFYSYSYADDKMTRSTGGFVYVPSGSNFSITTTVPPSRCTAMHHRNGAAWYKGAGDK